LNDDNEIKKKDPEKLIHFKKRLSFVDKTKLS
jgi:hypothetical protein